MAGPVKIEDGGGRTIFARVTQDGALQVSPVPPANATELSDAQLTRQKQYVSFLEDEAGSSQMAVDGSVTPAEFSTSPLSGEAIHLGEIRFEFESGRLDMSGNDVRRFGDAAGTGGLTTGVEGYVIQGGISYPLFLEPLQHMGDHFRYCDPDPAYAADGVAVNVDVLTWIYRPMAEITLPRGTIDRLFLRVNDVLTALASYKVIVRGWREEARL